MENKPKDIHKKTVYGELYPLPFSKGGKMGVNVPKKATGGSLTGVPDFKPKNTLGGSNAFMMNDGGKTKPAAAKPAAAPAKPTGSEKLKGVFNREQRTQNRFNTAVNQAMTGCGSSSFRSASKFKLPSGATAQRGQQVMVTPTSQRTQTAPGTKAVAGTPSSTTMSLKGFKSIYSPAFVETGAQSYGKASSGAPQGSYNQLPAKMNPDLKAALEQAIANKQTTAMWKGKAYKAGNMDRVPEFQTSFNPGKPSIPAMSATFEDTPSFNARTGGMNQSFGKGPKRRLPRLPWLEGKNDRTEAGF